MKNILRLGISLGLAALLLWFVFKDISLSAMFDRFARADRGWLALSCVIILIAHVLRAWRWNMLLAPLGNRPRLSDSILAVFTGYFANYVFPRMGEVTRCGTLYKLSGVPVNQSLGTVVAERIFDVISLLVLIVLNFFLEFDRLSRFFTEFFLSKFPSGSSPLLIVLALVGLAAIIGVIFVVKNQRLRHRLMANGLVQKVMGFLKGMWEGIISIRNLKSPGLFILATLGIWVGYYFSSYVLFFCIPETSTLGPHAGLTLLVIGAIGMTAPTQGGIGAYHLLVGNVMVLYGLTQSDGISLATFIHGSQMLLMLIVGALSFVVVMARKPPIKTINPNTLKP